jgi:hypothetical protein
LRQQERDSPHAARGDHGGQQSLQLDHHLQKGPSGHQGRQSSIRDEVLPDGGAAAVSQELHGGDSRDGQRDGHLRGPYQLRHQKRGVAYPLQRRRPPAVQGGGKWYCSYPVLKECHDPAMLPVDKVRIDPVKINISLGKSIYTKEQLEEFARFQDSQGTRKA